MPGVAAGLIFDNVIAVYFFGELSADLEYSCAVDVLAHTDKVG